MFWYACLVLLLSCVRALPALPEQDDVALLQTNSESVSAFGSDSGAENDPLLDVLSFQQGDVANSSVELNPRMIIRQGAVATNSSELNPRMAIQQGGVNNSTELKPRSINHSAAATATETNATDAVNASMVASTVAAAWDRARKIVNTELNSITGIDSDSDGHKTDPLLNILSFQHQDGVTSTAGLKPRQIATTAAMGAASVMASKAAWDRIQQVVNTELVVNTEQIGARTNVNNGPTAELEPRPTTLAFTASTADVSATSTVASTIAVTWDRAREFISTKLLQIGAPANANHGPAEFITYAIGGVLVGICLVAIIVAVYRHRTEGVNRKRAQARTSSARLSATLAEHLFEHKRETISSRSEGNLIKPHVHILKPDGHSGTATVLMDSSGQIW